MIQTDRASTLRIGAWASWDWGAAAFNSVVTTFVFVPWLTSGEAFAVAGASDQVIERTTALHSQWLGWAGAAAGLVVACTAPVLGTFADAAGRRRPLLAVCSAVVGASILAMWFVRPVEGRLSQMVVLGLVLVAVGTVAFEIGSAAYNALLLTITTPRTFGRISGIGWGAGYVGGIVLLVGLFVAFLSGEPQVADFRWAFVVSGAWFVVFALPVLLLVPDRGAPGERQPAVAGRVVSRVADAYRTVVRDLVRLWRTDRATCKFLVASAVFRDGLTGVFVYGAVLAKGSFGFTTQQVMVFAIAANLVAGVATVAAGWLDDRFGPRRVITWALVVLIGAGTALFVLRGLGAPAFWVCGLLLSVCVGPVQASSRAMLARLSERGHETQMFGLYATTGKAGMWMAAVAWSVAIALGGAQYWGILGIVAVLLVGLALFVPVRFPQGRGVEGRWDLTLAETTG
ncbi:MAG: MFS transporter [Micrococcales bacterium]|nr:MFS transporter [Micrococcales bacterium]